jgi:hypothetical protein
MFRFPSTPFRRSPIGTAISLALGFEHALQVSAALLPSSILVHGGDFDRAFESDGFDWAIEISIDVTPNPL